jgi:hypothetical protein
MAFLDTPEKKQQKEKNPKDAMRSHDTPQSMDDQFGIGTFLWEALRDNQATIRAIDGKLATMLLVQVAPIPLAAGMYKFSITWVGRIGPWMYLGMCLVFAVLWFLSFYHLFSGILARCDSSGLRVRADQQPTGTMFPGDDYLHSNSLDLKKYLDELPANAKAIKEEIAFEILKVAHIRITKAHHQRAALIFIAFWVGISIAALMVYGEFLLGAGR